MGNKASSSSNQNITNNIVNKNLLDTVNKTVMESAVSTMINNASSCSSAIDQNNNCSMNDASIAGDFTMGGTQSNKAKVNFSCIQASQTSADMATSMAASMAAEMKAASGTAVAAQLNNASQAANSSGFGATGGSSASNSNTNVNTNITNDTIAHVENIFSQNLSNNFTANTVNECIGKTTQSNNISASGIKVGGNAKISCDQTNSLESVQECKQLSEAISKTILKTAQELGMKTETSNTAATKTEATSTSKSENVSTGAIQDLGGAVSGILGSVTGLASLAVLGPILAPICCCCCCIICICLIIIIGKSMMGGSSPAPSQSIPYDTSSMTGGDIILSLFDSSDII